MLVNRIHCCGIRNFIAEELLCGYRKKAGGGGGGGGGGVSLVICLLG